AVKLAEAHLDEPFLVFNGDVITEIDLTEMLKQHRKVKPKVSIALTPVEDPTAYGVVETDKEGMVRRFVEKPPREEVTTNMINAGIYLLEPEVLGDVPAGEKCMFENWVFPRLLERGEAMLSYPSGAYWIDIGTPEKYLQANHDLLREWGEEVRFQGNSEVHPSARIKGPALIGEGCIIEENVQITGPAVLGPGCRVERGAKIEGAVIWENVRVGGKAVMHNCIIGSGVQAGVRSHVAQYCVIGDNVRLGEGGRVPESTRVDPDSSVRPG
ncbi:MAG: NDP-sugar synthase, partial [Chloroflexota bacterium]